MASRGRQARKDTAAALAGAGRWDAAGAAYEELARAASAAGRLDEARACWASAGDAYRRDDRPARAARALKAALDLSDQADPRRALAVAGLASVLIEAGEPVPAEILVREALAGVTEPPLRVLLLDLLLGALVVLGRVQEASGPLAELSAATGALPPAARPLASATLRFRQAVLLRLRGDLEPAAHLLGEVEAEMSARKETLGAAAAAAGEQGEVLLASGDGAGAAEAFDRAARAWTTAGRRAGLYRCESGLIRAALARGETPIARALDNPIAYARERGLPLLEAELRVSRGLARARAHVRGAEEDLDLAIGLAERASAALLEGRARLVRRRAGFLRDDLARTRALLVGDALWSAGANEPQVGEDRGPW